MKIDTSAMGLRRGESTCLNPQYEAGDFGAKYKSKSYSKYLCRRVTN